ncbi:metallophosphoesterase [Brevibacillus panacihumi]|uniref:Metallophosphoesterase n=1 Tax=Brevibacillus panacihumi TaxID=497735 RepID=A0A3M8D1L9_9BACL|nr:metallophosphoesterase [Brevibacillus panacihumi]RNB81974.1 metallophosphoesterase [Brevibacillus panacihumi]
MNDPRIAPISRKTFLSKAIKCLGGIVGLGAATGAYAFGWERTWLDVVRIHLTIPGLGDSYKGTKLIHFSDAHLGHYMETSDLQAVVSVIQNEHPDIICFTGDLVDESISPLAAAIPILDQLQAPLGKFAVLGNHDYRINQQKSVREGLAASGFEVLENRHVAVTKNGESLYMAGVEDVLHGKPDLAQAISDIPEGEKVILLVHEPDFADEAAKYPIHLQLSGHSHGGQVRLPWFGHLVTPPLARRYVQGLYRVGPDQMPVYVNRGLGTTILPVRFFCRPEITVLTLQ